MQKKFKRYSATTGILFLIFILFTVIVKTVDVQPVGPNESTVGLATLNQFVFQKLGENALWYRVTDVLGAVAIATAFAFALLGLLQLISRKSLKKVDSRILLLGVFYFIVIVFYAFFELVVINYRPVILSEGLEASYPSSHTMLVVCIMSTAILQFHYYLWKWRYGLLAADIVAAAIIVVTVIGRLLSGVHWFTDIVAGVILASALTALYCSALLYVEGKRKRKRKRANRT